MEEALYPEHVRLRKRLFRGEKWWFKKADQHKWTNYAGRTKRGPVPNPYKTKYPF